MIKTLKIEGMSCMHCVGAVTKALKAIDGISDVVVDLENKSAIIETNGAVTEKVLCDVVEETGFKVIKID